MATDKESVRGLAPGDRSTHVHTVSGSRAAHPDPSSDLRSQTHEPVGSLSPHRKNPRATGHWQPGPCPRRRIRHTQTEPLQPDHCRCRNRFRDSRVGNRHRLGPARVPPPKRPLLAVDRYAGRRIPGFTRSRVFESPDRTTIFPRPGDVYLELFGRAPFDTRGASSGSADGYPIRTVSLLG